MLTGSGSQFDWSYCQMSPGRRSQYRLADGYPAPRRDLLSGSITLEGWIKRVRPPRQNDEFQPAMRPLVRVVVHEGRKAQPSLTLRCPSLLQINWPLVLVCARTFHTTEKKAQADNLPPASCGCMRKQAFWHILRYIFSNELRILRPVRDISPA